MQPFHKTGEPVQEASGLASGLAARSTSWTAPWVAPWELTAEEQLAYPEAIFRVEEALRLGIDPSLEPMQALLEELGRPDRHCACIQVAGTNGKTSTSRFTAALLRVAGFKTGLYTSPHLVSYTERVEIDGTPVHEELFARGVSYALAAWKRICARRPDFARQGCTEFELLTAAAMCMYAAEACDYVVLEVGLGGRWDATTACATCACAITGIGLDHMHILGNTLQAIAGEKAGVIKDGIPCVLGKHALEPASVLDVFQQAAGRAGSVLIPTRHQITRMPQGLDSSFEFTVELQGRRLSGISYTGPIYQAQNCACALTLADLVLDKQGLQLDADSAQTALAGCPIPGRFQILQRDPLVMVDACHNPQSAEACAQAIETALPRRQDRPALLLGVLADKDFRGIAQVLLPLFDRVFVTRSSSGRALPASELSQVVRDINGRAPEAVFESAQQATEALRGQSFICCGTITLIGEIAELMA